jgi:hypothetical protein
MKLAEALSLRKDLEKRISGLKDRLENVARIQEGEEPSENPEELMTELDRCLEQLEQLIYNINVTNVKIVCEDGRTMTKLLSERDILNKRISILRNTFDHASGSANRYCRSEVRMVATIDVKSLRQKLDKHSLQYRQLDMMIQMLNFTNDLIE